MAEIAQTTEWVVGRGLLGSAIERVRPSPGFRAIVPWGDDEQARDALAAAAGEFFRDEPEDWRIYWCAGRGVTSTPRDQLEAEAAVFASFLDSIETHSGGRAGTVFLASSVGGAYGGRSDPPYTEETPPRPGSAYGEAKLAMEASLTRWAVSTGSRALIARITNLYGPGQDLAKGQGLISTILRGHLLQTPATIFVSLDTLRDYVYVDDCALIATTAMDRLAGLEGGTVVTKIIGSMDAVSISAIIGEAKRLRRNAAPIMIGQGTAAGQASDLRVASTVWADLDGLARTTLPAGMHATFAGMLAQWAAR